MEIAGTGIPGGTNERSVSRDVGLLEQRRELAVAQTHLLRRQDSPVKLLL